MVHLPLVITAGLFAVPAAMVVVPSGMELVAEQNGVTVYQREASKVIDLVAEGDFVAPPDRVRAVLLDYGRHPRFLSHVAESVVLARGAFLLVYQRLALPVISDRDFTLRVEWGSEGEALWMKFATANDRGPAPKKGIVRIALHEGEWRLDPVDGGKHTHARYSVRLDLAGSLPRWMSRSRAGDDLPELFEAVRAQLR